MTAETKRILDGKIIRYHWNFEGYNVFLDLPSYGILGGNFNRAEKEPEFLSETKKYIGFFCHRVGVA
ncbi:MAG: hypothetical protein WC716_16605 [Chitinophagaceae bacterium]|jgi:hypothetical protein